MLNLQIHEEEARFVAEVCGYYVTRTRLGMTEERISALISEYTASWRRKCRAARERLGLKEYFAGPRIEWGAGEDPDMLDLIQRGRKVNGCFNYLHWAWMQRTTKWGKSMDGVTDATRSFSDGGQIFEIRALATWFVNGSRNHGVGPVKAVFELDVPNSRLRDYTIWFLDREKPDGELHQDRAKALPPASEEGWRYILRMGESPRATKRKTSDA